MRALVTTLRTVLVQADVHFEAGRVPQARTGFEDLLERAQERTDRPMEVIARAMLARCHLKRRDPEAARTELDLAEHLVDPEHLESHGRYRAARARLAIEGGAPSATREELRAYLRWAEDAGAAALVVDAALLLAAHDEDPEPWLERAIDHALGTGVDKPLGHAYASLAALLDERERHEEALEAYQQALQWHRRAGSPRQVVAAGWAAGSVACRLEDHPLARTLLEDAVKGAEEAEDCGDLLALALADLAVVYEAAGDVIEARRLLIRSSALAREQDLPRFWPERWRSLVAHGKRLELDL